ncbi:fibronectin type III domain-containing protein [Micromonospora sp. WMMD1102]|uniref:fibronectin type III domain-containing protein n=1 Tax=Micromonospora sp. WMMD1102 TaxID=3016105 RepID=UPI00241554E3|nr:fibronectin type III domain-containing protein [Micromonospora sp. WMMD1102]MDG4791592.1 fibronectin type III domain-containing protein [Micromonospora sp. WMMD1102]
MAIRTALLATLGTLVVAAAGPGGTSPALAGPVDRPPSTPGTPVATEVTETSALLTWRPSTDDVGVTGYEVWYLRDGGNGFHGNTPVPSYRFTALTPDTSYTWMVRASDGRNHSRFSAPVTFRTDPAPVDSEPPSPPGAPVPSQVTATSVTLDWTPSTDNASAPTYLLHGSAEGTGNATVLGGGSTTSTTVRRLIPDLNYDVHLVARDVSGNVSAPSARTRFRTAVDPTAACRAAFRAAGAGRPAVVLVTNTGPAPLAGWSVRFTLPGDQRIGYAGHAFAQHGRDVVLWWSGWSDEFSVGETLALDLYLDSGTLPGPPDGVTLNGTPCPAAG